MEGSVRRLRNKTNYYRTLVAGNTPDITEYVRFKWYEPVYYYEDLPFPQSKRILAKWLGVAHCVGQALCYWVMTENAQVLA
jgi:hypothetical protein